MEAQIHERVELREDEERRYELEVAEEGGGGRVVGGEGKEGKR